MKFLKHTDIETDLKKTHAYKENVYHPLGQTYRRCNESYSSLLWLFFTEVLKNNTLKGKFFFVETQMKCESLE